MGKLQGRYLTTPYQTLWSLECFLGFSLDPLGAEPFDLGTPRLHHEPASANTMDETVDGEAIFFAHAVR